MVFSKPESAWVQAFLCYAELTTERTENTVPITIGISHLKVTF